MRYRRLLEAEHVDFRMDNFGYERYPTIKPIRQKGVKLVPSDP